MYPHNPPSYGANPNPPYLRPAYPNQYLQQQPDDGRTAQGHMANGYDTNMNAYNYNRNAPAFSPAAVASGVPPLPIFQGWNQDAMPLPPYTAPQSGGQYNNGYSGNVQSQQYYPPPVQPAYQQQAHGFQNNEVDEGEYDGGTAANNNQSASYGAAQYRGNDGTGYIDTALRALYPRTQDYSPQQSYPANNYNYPQREQAQSRRQPSGSYSPYAATANSNNAERPSGAHHQSTYSQGQLQESIVPPPVIPAPIAVPAKPKSWPQKSAKQTEPKPVKMEPKSMTNVQHPVQNGQKSVQRVPQAAPIKKIPAVQRSTDEVFSKSIVEERKIAQGAILKAWPLGVRFKAYLDEGIEEKLIEQLFIDSNLPPSKAEFGKEMENGNASQVEEAGASLSQAFPKPQNGVLGAPGTSKPRRTSIPPLSVNTNGNLATKIPAAQTSAEKIPTPTTAMAPKPASMIEKDKALKSKMDALKKSREDRAQKAAARNGSLPSATVPAVVASQDVVSPKLPDKPSSLKESSLAPATNSLSKSPSVPKNDLSLPAKPPPSLAKQQSAPEPAPKSAPIQHQLPAIPGLFLASSAPTPAPQLPVRSAVQSPVQGNQRKRPVAADFDEPVSSMATFKRPFGQNRNDKPLVIDVSEDEFESEDEDVAMDLESVADDTPVQPTQKHSDHSIPTAQSQSAFNNSIQPKVSFASTPPQQMPRLNPAGHEEILQQKESQIEELKKKIAEAVAKQNRKSKRNNSRAQTPRAIETASAETASRLQENGVVLTETVRSMVSQQLVATEEERMMKKQREQTESRAAEATKLSEPKRVAAEQKRLLAEQKRTQRLKMASDIAALRAADKQKLQEIERQRAAVAEMEALRVQNLENQRMLEEQMLLLAEEEEEEEHSGQVSETEPMETFKSQLAEAQADHILDHPINSNVETGQISASTNEQKTIEESTVAESDQEVEAGSNNVEDITQIDRVSSSAMPDPTSANEAHQSGGHADISRHISEEPMDDPKSSLSADQALEAALQEAARVEADSHAHTEEDIDMDISSPADPMEVQRALQEHVAEAPNSPAYAPDSPAYSPELHRDVPDVSEIPDRESDDYEPPEATPPADAPRVATSPSPVDSPPFSPAPPAEVLEPVDDMVLDVDFIHSPNEKASPNGTAGEQVVATDAGSTQMVETHTEPTDGPRAFIPYESALKNFRAYRFHPQFKQDVPGGLRSMTYSHRINPDKELCRWELAGGKCNDDTCDMQHFLDIGLPDDAVLTALGSPDEFQGEQRDRFCVGLKGVLMRMRLNKVRDFNVIASEIIAHRKKFLGDDSKVLPLEGTNI